ncbi:MAG: chemotaxis protein CheA [Nitrospinales bacterium]
MDEVISEFLVESFENLDQLDLDLVELEQRPADEDLLSNIFRTIHTIKGTCGFLGDTKLEALTHIGENLLSKLRDGELTLTADRANALLSMADALRQMLSCIESTHDEGNMDYSILMETLSRLTCEEEVCVPARPRATCKDAKRAEKSILNRFKVMSKTTNVSVRVDVELLDKLMSLVGELVLTRNQIVQHASESQNNDPDYVATLRQLNLLTSELQENMMKIRMQPIGNIWNRFPRIVQGLSMSCGKKVRIVMEGAETALDKTAIAVIRNALTHIVRNSIDHGIEDPRTRTANGKPEEGLLFLRAFYEEGQVIIEIRDDGRGIDDARIKKHALERGVITQEQASRMSDREWFNLIFAPGFSTAAKITNVSGRGVGMDIVKTNIEKIGGTVHVQSTFNEGTCLKLMIPRLFRQVAEKDDNLFQ